jgi:hypothetical protein
MSNSRSLAAGILAVVDELCYAEFDRVRAW